MHLPFERALAIAAIAALADTAGAQAAVAPQLPAYRIPAIGLAQPPNGGSVPTDHPLVVFRYLAGEATDPLDAQSFRVSIDGVDRTPRFRVTPTEAWGDLVGADTAAALAPGPHRIAARVCSTRGACAEMTATVVATPPVTVAGAAPAAADTSAGKKGKLSKTVDVLIDVARRIIKP